MKTKKILAVLAAVCILAIGSLSANEIEFSLVGTLRDASELALLAQVMNLAASMVAAPRPSGPGSRPRPLPVNIVRPQGFRATAGSRRASSPPPS